MASRNTPFHGLALAIGFCTRFAPTSAAITRERDFEHELASSMTWFPVVGGIIGLAMVLPWSLGLLDTFPWLQAWGALAVSIWLTKALHWDGLADVADGWGSNASGERFWSILKDSRCGVFAVLAVVLFAAGQLAVFHAILSAKAWAALVWCPIVGRSAVPLLCLLCKDFSRPGMGRSFIIAAGYRHLLLPALIAIAACWLLSPLAVGIGLLLLFLALLRMRGLARGNNGCNGDFLGAAVICGELCAGLGWALAN